VQREAIERIKQLQERDNFLLLSWWFDFYTGIRLFI